MRDQEKGKNDLYKIYHICQLFHTHHLHRPSPIIISLWVIVLLGHLVQSKAVYSRV